MRLLLSDKEGHFVVTPEDIFAEKALQAVTKCFKRVNVDCRDVKGQAISRLNECNLMSLATAVMKAEGDRLYLFFSAKTHKINIPFRAIVSEAGTWQYTVSSYLQKHLSTLVIHDPFVVDKTDRVNSFLKHNNPGFCSGFSVDIEDLYYSLPHKGLLEAVKKCIVEDNDEVGFMGQCGISVDAFLELVILFKIHIRRVARRSLCAKKGCMYWIKGGTNT